MLTSTKLGSLRALGSCRALAILAAVLVCGQQGLSFKLSEAPIPLAGSEENETIRQAVEEAVSERLERDMEDINNISNPTMENASDSMEGLGLAKNLEFLLVKVAQLEAVAEMQQAQANRQQKKIDLQQKEIDSLKAQIGNHKVPEGEALLQTEEEDAQTRLKEAQEIVKSVFLKHHRQREKGILHRERETASAAESGTSRESSSDRDSASLKRRSRWGFVGDWVGSATDAFVDGYKHASDKAAWLRDNTISTVEEAVAKIDVRMC